MTLVNQTMFAAETGWAVMCLVGAKKNLLLEQSFSTFACLIKSEFTFGIKSSVIDFLYGLW